VKRAILFLILASPIFAADPCDRRCLGGFVTTYLNALVAHKPGDLPVAASVKFTEDGHVSLDVTMQGETVRVSGKDRDTLQDVMAKLKANDFGIDMTFDNYRTN